MGIDITLINAIQNLIDAIYEQDTIGGPLHIVLDDGNFDDESIKWCQEVAINNEQDIVLKTLCKQCAFFLLLLLPEEQRIKEFLNV